MRADSVAGLRLDVATARVLVWLARAGRAADLTADAHLYFVDRYQRLAGCYRERGREDKARHMEEMAAEHSLCGNGDGPPYAAAMAMPRPRRWLATDAISRHHRRRSDAAA